MAVAIKFLHFLQRFVEFLWNETLWCNCAHAFQKLHTFQFKGSLEGWIRRLVYHSLADYYRKADRKMRFLEVEDRDAPIASEGLQNLYLDDLLLLIDRLPDATKEVFVLCDPFAYN